MATEDDFELQRSDITLVRQLGIGEYGPIYDAEVKVKKNLITRALVKVTHTHQNRKCISRCGCKISMVCKSTGFSEGYQSKSGRLQQG